MLHDPPELNRLAFGWTSEGRSGAYFPVSLTSRVEVAPSDMLKLTKAAASVTAHAPHKDAIVHLPRWLVHCAPICCNPKTVSLLQETEYDLDIDSDTISDNSDTDVSDNDEC